MSARSSLRRPLLGSAISVLALCAAAPTAFAGTAAVSSGQISYRAQDGEINDVLFEKMSGGYRITDDSAPVLVGAGCTRRSTNTALCTGTISTVEVDLGDQNDTIDLRGGVDDPSVNAVAVQTSVFTGPGDDVAKGGVGRDNMYAEGGADRLVGNNGNDWLYGGATQEGGFGNDHLYGMAKSGGSYYYYGSTLNGGDGVDLLYGSPTSDSLQGGGGADYIRGAGGVDTAMYSDKAATVRVTLDNIANDGLFASGASTEKDDVRSDVENVVGGSGNDTIVGNDLNNNLQGGSGADLLQGLGGEDVLGTQYMYSYGGEAGNDRMEGGQGDDFLQGGEGADKLYGGTMGMGNDFIESDTVSYSDKYSYTGAPIELKIDLDGVADDGVRDNSSTTANEAEGDLVGADIENVIGSEGKDEISGNGAPNRIEGRGGEDSLYGGANDDQLIGDFEHTSSSDGADFLAGGDGEDILNGGWGYKTVDNVTQGDTIKGGTAFDVVTYQNRTAQVNVTLATNAYNDGEGAERDLVDTTVDGVIGGSGPDILTGSGWHNALFGEGGDDTLNGLGGDDTLDGGVYGYGGTDSDEMWGGAGLDTVSYRRQYQPVRVTLDNTRNDGATGENDLVHTVTSGENGIENVIGGRGGDVITGNALPNSLMGDEGSDNVDGAGGNDFVAGGFGMDLLQGGIGNDTLNARGDASHHYRDTLDCGEHAGDADEGYADPAISTAMGPTLADTVSSASGSPIQCESIVKTRTATASAASADAAKRPNLGSLKVMMRAKRLSRR